MRTFIINTIGMMLFGLQRAFAQPRPAPSFPLPNPLGNRTITEILGGIGSSLLTISIPIVAILITWGGLQMLFAAGSAEKFAQGKKTVLYTVIGFAIVIVAQGIASLIRELLRRP